MPMAKLLLIYDGLDIINVPYEALIFSILIISLLIKQF